MKSIQFQYYRMEIEIPKLTPTQEVYKIISFNNFEKLKKIEEIILMCKIKKKIIKTFRHQKQLEILCKSQQNQVYYVDL